VKLSTVAVKKHLVCTFPEWAESLTDLGKGKHFIGDFLPPEELDKFMETFKALKVSLSLNSLKILAFIL